MQRRDISENVLRASEAFVTIDGEDFFVEDWLKKTGCRDSGRPWVIVAAFQDAGEQSVVLRDGEFKKEILSLTEFTKAIRAKEFYRIPKPLFGVGQSLKNRFTEKFLRIIQVPFAPNDKDGAYMYFVRVYTPTYGHNFDIISERQLLDLYMTEGVDLK